MNILIDLIKRQKKLSGEYHWTEIPLTECEKYLHSVSFEVDEVAEDFDKVVDCIRLKGMCIIRQCMPTMNIKFIHKSSKKWFANSESENDKEFHIEKLVHGLTAPNIEGLSDSIAQMLQCSVFHKIGQAFFNCNDKELTVPENHILIRKRVKKADDFIIARSASNSEKDNPKDLYGKRHSFHQDQTLIPSSFPLNLWIPLTNVDARSTGLAFLLPFTNESYDLPFPENIEDFFSGTDSFIISPHLKVGDAIIFSGRTVHGSYTQTREFKPRMSIECRVGCMEKMDPNYDDEVLYI